MDSLWLENSGQKWKVILSEVLMLPFVVVLLLMLIGCFNKLGETSVYLLFSITFILGCAGILFESFGVKCSCCRGFPALVRLKYAGTENTTRIRKWTDCPICGDDGKCIAVKYEKTKSTPTTIANIKTQNKRNVLSIISICGNVVVFIAACLVGISIFFYI